MTDYDDDLDPTVYDDRPIAILTLIVCLIALILVVTWSPAIDAEQGSATRVEDRSCS